MSLIQCTTLFGQTKLVPQERLVFRPSVYGLILHQQHVLLITTCTTGNYYFPGGGIERGERMTDALRRKVREETGIEIDVTDLVHIEEQFFFHDPTEEAWHSFLFFFRCTPQTFQIVHDATDSEVATVEWHAVVNLQPETFQHAARNAVQRLKSLPPA